MSACRVPEAVFSSTGFRIRAAQGQAADHVLPDHLLTGRGVTDQVLKDQGLANRGIAGLAERAAATLFFTFFPADCGICNAPIIKVSRIPVCKHCLDALHPLEGSYCAVCGAATNLPVHSAAAGADRNRADRNNNSDDVRCLLCQRVDPPYERAVAYGSYEGELRDLIHLLKFEQVRPAAAILGRVLAGTVANLERGMPVGKIAVVPVPLYKRKQAQRGFNQAEMIAREAVKELSRPQRFELCAGILLRRRETASQIGLTSHQRRENMRGAFTVSEATGVVERGIVKRDILLIDDVVTTGTTVSECARVLLRAGAARVWVATVARTLKISDRISLSEKEFSVPGSQFSVHPFTCTENRELRTEN
jgi:ComF family protein